MVNRAKLSEWFTTGSEWLNEQQWYQQIWGKWDELDPQSKTYVKFALAILAGISVLFMMVSSVWKVHSLKAELEEKINLVSFIQSSNDEIRSLKETTPGIPPSSGKDDAADPWLSYFETVATAAGIEAGSLKIQSEKSGQTTDYSKESLIELDVKHINIRQLVHVVTGLESGRRPVKLRNLQVKAQDDLTGYLDATLALSSFSLIQSP
jgi:hypothetical protein